MFDSAEIRKRNGVVYTPSNLATYVASKVMGYFFESLARDGKAICPVKRSHLKRIKIIDPACGDGELLISAWKAFYEKCSTFLGKSAIPNLDLDPGRALCGLDIDEKAIFRTKNRIFSLYGNNPKTSSFNLMRTNALFPLNRKSRTAGWKHISKRFQAEGFDVVIANPPWGADTTLYHDILSNGEYVLYKGQFDTSDLFIELALHIVRPGGYFAFIVSDSLFSMERAPLRKMLLEETEVKFIGRFGEKLFEKINRACAVIICRKVKPAKSAHVDCFRLTPPYRKKILKEEITFNEAERSLLHKVSQNRFFKNSGYSFDIDVKKPESKTLAIFKSSAVRFRDYLTSSRGVELSKKGKVCKCNHCGLWLPYPVSRNPKCSHCKEELVLSNIFSMNIVSDAPIDGYEPLLVGESINRYSLNSKYFIATDKKGIAYKNRELYKGPKLVLRKTGVGLLAAIDYQDSFTNQVVYMFKLRSSFSTLPPLEFFLAIMNSRAIYYYLAKKYGETEWRSHPYLTQTQILDLPLPNLDLTTGFGLQTSKKIAKYLRPYLINGQKLPARVDAIVEHLIANMYGLSKDHYKRIYDAITEAEELVPIKPLKQISIADIFGA